MVESKNNTLHKHIQEHEFLEDHFGKIILPTYFFFFSIVDGWASQKMSCESLQVIHSPP